MSEWSWPIDKPRDHAARIAALPTREARAAALAEIPEAWREWVRILVVASFAIRKPRTPN